MLRLSAGTPSLFRSWAFAASGLVGPSILQVGYLLVAARALEVTDFGNFMLLISVTVVAWSFAGFGAGGVTLKMIARNPGEAREAFGRALAFTMLTLPLLLPVIVLAGALITRGALPFWMLAAVAFVELTFTRMTQTCSSVFIGLGEQGHSSLMLMATPTMRLLAAFISVAWPTADRFSMFATSYCGAAAAAGTFCTIYVMSRIGRSSLSLRGYRLWDGFTFSLTDLNSALQSEVDKLLLGLLATPGAVAVYTIASRLMDGAIMPSRALRVAMHSRLFREGGSRRHGSLGLTIKMLPLVGAYGLVAWIGFAILAPGVAWLFGSGYERLTTILPLLGALPLLRAITELAAEVFVTSDRPGLQVLVQSLGLLVRFALGLFLIANFGIDGAIASTLAVTAVTGVVLWGIALDLRGPARAGAMGWAARAND